jgi:hypothetical protein
MFCSQDSYNEIESNTLWIARNLQMSSRSLWRILHEEQRFHSYKTLIIHELKECYKASSVNFRDHTDNDDKVSDNLIMLCETHFQSSSYITNIIISIRVIILCRSMRNLYIVKGLVFRFVWSKAARLSPWYLNASELCCKNFFHSGTANDEVKCEKYIVSIRWCKDQIAK